jgi:hypothetical protein
MKSSPPVRGALAVVLVAALGLAGGVALAPVGSSAALRPPRSGKLSTTPPSNPLSTTPTNVPGSTPTTIKDRNGGSGCSPTALSKVRATVDGALTKRVSEINSLIATVGAATNLAASDRAALSTDLGRDRSGIGTLLQSVSTEPACASVLADGRAMVSDYRVFVVMAPQVHLTIVADSETAIAAQLKAAEPGIENAISRARSAGKDVAAADSALASLQAEVITAVQDSAGISSTALAFTPASYPGCWQTFQGERHSLEQGRQALRQADTDLADVVGDLG